MTDNPKDAERLAEIRHREYEFRDKFDRPDYDPMPELDGEFLIRLLDTAEKEVIRLTQERDNYKQASLDCHDALGKCTVERDTILGRDDRYRKQRGEARRDAEKLRALIDDYIPTDCHPPATQPSADDVERARKIVDKAYQDGKGKAESEGQERGLSGNVILALSDGYRYENLCFGFAAARAEGVREGIERAAKVCDERSQWAEDKITEDDEGGFAGYSNACDDCAELVRALAAPETQEEKRDG